MADLKAATDIDPNVWYQLTEAAVDDYDGDFVSMLQPISQDDDLHVWPANAKAYWQFQPTGDKPGRYAIRCSMTTTQKQLSVCYRPKVPVQNRRTHACLLDSDGGTDQHWDVASWGNNGTYRLINVKNGTDYYLDCVPNGPVFMSPNHEGYQMRQHWLMTSVKNVDDAAYSTVFSNAPSTSTTDPATTTNSASDTQSSASESSNVASSQESLVPESSDSNGLSSGAIAGISVGATLVAVALAILAFFLWRRKRKSQSSKPVETATVPPYGSTIGGEKPSSTPPSVQEMLHEQSPLELHGEGRHELA